MQKMTTPQSSQRSSRFHKPAVPRAALGIATIFASMQQPVDRFCKAILPERHRLEDPILALRHVGSALAARVVQQKRHDVESVASAGANPAASTNLAR